MLNFNSNSNNSVTYDNTVVLNGQLTFQLSDDEIQRVKAGLENMIAKRNVKSGLTFADDKKPAKKQDEVPFPNLGDAYAVGHMSFYDNDLAVRTWENGFRRENTKYALKKAVTDAGGVWSDDKKAYVFKTKKAYNACKKAQEAYEANRK